MKFRNHITTFSAFFIVLLAGIAVIWGLYDADHEPSTVNINQTFSLSVNAVTFNNIDDLHKISDLIVVGSAVDNFVERDHKITYFEDGTMESFHTVTPLHRYRLIRF